MPRGEVIPPIPPPSDREVHPIPYTRSDGPFSVIICYSSIRLPRMQTITLSYDTSTHVLSTEGGYAGTMTFLEAAVDPEGAFTYIPVGEMQK